MRCFNSAWVRNNSSSAMFCREIASRYCALKDCLSLRTQCHCVLPQMISLRFESLVKDLVMLLQSSISVARRSSFSLFATSSEISLRDRFHQTRDFDGIGGRAQGEAKKLACEFSSKLILEPRSRIGSLLDALESGYFRQKHDFAEDETLHQRNLKVRRSVSGSS